MNQVRHVFIGQTYNNETLKHGRDASDAAVNVAQKNAIVFINPDKPIEENLIRTQADMTEASRFQVGVFLEPNNLDCDELILSPVIEKTSPRLDITPIKWRPFDHDRATDQYCSIIIRKFPYVQRLYRGQTLVLRLRFTNIYDLSPGQKYFDFSYQLRMDKPTTSYQDARPYIIQLVKRFAKMVNRHPYVSKFIQAWALAEDESKTQSEDDIALILDAKDGSDYNSYQRYPNRLIDFEASFMYEDEQVIYAPGENSEEELTDTLENIKTGAQYSAGDPRNVMDAEKFSEGYRGVTNITAFPVTNPPLRTKLNRVYNAIVFNIERPYKDPANIEFLSNETVEVYFETPTQTELDMPGDDPDGFTKQPENVQGLLLGIKDGIVSFKPKKQLKHLSYTSDETYDDDIE